MGIDFKRDSAGIAEVLKSPGFAAAVHEAAQSIAGHARAAHPDAEIVVDDYVTDRAASSVTVKDPRARLWQVRDGHLTRAAAQAGLEVRSR